MDAKSHLSPSPNPLVLRKKKYIWLIENIKNQPERMPIKENFNPNGIEWILRNRLNNIPVIIINNITGICNCIEDQSVIKHINNKLEKIE